MKVKFPELSAVAVAEDAPLKVTVAAAPAVPREPDNVNVKLKFTPLTLAPATVTCCDAGENVVFPFVGVMVYVPFETPKKVKLPLESAVTLEDVTPLPLRVTVDPTASEAGVIVPAILKVVPVVVIPVALRLIVAVDGVASETTVRVPLIAPVVTGNACRTTDTL